MSDNSIGDSGATALSHVRTVNTTVLLDDLPPLDYEEEEEKEDEEGDNDKEKDINW